MEWWWRVKIFLIWGCGFAETVVVARKKEGNGRGCCGTMLGGTGGWFYQMEFLFWFGFFGILGQFNQVGFLIFVWILWDLGLFDQ